MVRLEQIDDLAGEFVRVRLLRIQDVDLHQFEFDYDLTWAAFFLNASGKVYGRFGGRDARGADTRNSLAGLHYAMAAALKTHRRDPLAKPSAPAAAPLVIDQLLAAKPYKKQGCIHCHQVKEILRQEQIDAGTWKRSSIYTYPLPENIGITLDRDRGDRLHAVQPNSAAAQAGLQPGDLLLALNRLPVHSFADAQYALHKAPAAGSIPLIWQRAEKSFEGTVKLQENWRRTNVTWRPSLLDLLPSLRVYGSDLTAPEKKTLGLDPKRLAFREEAPVHPEALKMGVRENDVILGLNDEALEMTMEAFLGYVRQNYLIGDTVTLNLLRNGKRVNLRIQLR